MNQEQTTHTPLLTIPEICESIERYEIDKLQRVKNLVESQIIKRLQACAKQQHHTRHA